MTWLPYLLSPPYFVFATLMVVTALAAWLRGGNWERLGACLIVLDCVASSLVQDREHLMGPQYGIALVDTAFFLMLAALAVISRLWWATWAAGFLLFGIALHMAIIVDERIDPYAYAIGTGFYSHLLFGAVLVGALTRRPPPSVSQGSRGPKSPSAQIIQCLKIIAFTIVMAIIAFASSLSSPTPAGG